MSDLDELYSIGTFAQITELQDLGDKLRMIVLGHRRIGITAAAADLEPVSASTEPVENSDNATRRRNKRLSEKVKSDETSTVSQDEKTEVKQILMVDTENLETAAFETNQEIKVNKIKIA